MRVFSLICTLLLAVAGFAAAAPTADSVQTISDIISAATAQVQPLHERLSTADASQASQIESQIGAIATSTSEKVQAAAQGADFSPSDLATLTPIVAGFVSACGGGGGPLTVSEALDNLLNALGPLLESLGL